MNQYTYSEMSPTYIYVAGENEENMSKRVSSGKPRVIAGDVKATCQCNTNGDRTHDLALGRRTS